MKRFRPLLAGCLTALAVTVGWVAPALAHEGAGTLVVESRDPTSDQGVQFVVRLTWNNDGHPAAANATTLTATPVDADGTALTPVTLTPVDDDGRFGATVEFPEAGTWTVRFTAISPAATLEVQQQVEAPATTTTAPTTTEPPASTSTTADEVGTTQPENGGQNSVGGGAVFFGVLALTLGGAGYLALRARRYRRSMAAAAVDDSGSVDRST